jgi:hypothetical protein
MTCWWFWYQRRSWNSHSVQFNNCKCYFGCPTRWYGTELTIVFSRCPWVYWISDFRKLKISWTWHDQRFLQCFKKDFSLHQDPILNIHGILNFLFRRFTTPGTYSVTSEEFTWRLCPWPDLTVYIYWLFVKLTVLKHSTELILLLLWILLFYWHKWCGVCRANQNKINVGAVNPSIGLVFSVISILITLTTLITSSN